jgi:hypothetical protein
MRNKLSKLAMAVSLAAVSSVVMAQQAASLFGKLTDQNNYILRRANYYPDSGGELR